MFARCPSAHAPAGPLQPKIAPYETLEHESQALALKGALPVGSPAGAAADVK